MVDYHCFSDEDLLIFLSQLISSFGIREDFDSSLSQRYFSEGKLAQVVREIKQFLRLPCRFNVILVRSGFRTFIEQDPLINESTKALLRSMRQNNFSTSAIITHPVPMPIFGSLEFSRLAFPMHLDVADFIQKPFAVFASNIAHEMAHIILESTYHPLRYLETAVDLAAMVLGFSEITRAGAIAGDRTYGYLPPRQIEITYLEIKRLKK